MKSQSSEAIPLLAIGGLVAAGLATLALSSRWLEEVVYLQTGPIAPLMAPDVRADYVAGVLWAVVLSVVVAIWGLSVRMSGPLLIGWLAKAVVALGPMLFYDYTYGVDPDGYFVNAVTPGFTWQMFEVGQGTRNTQMLAWLHVNFLNSSFNATRLTFAFVGLVAVYLFYRAATLFLHRDDHRLFYLLLFVPSIAFWSSILGKDPITFFGIALYAYGVASWQRSGRGRDLLIVAAGIAVAAFIRTWLGPILLIPLCVLGCLRSVTFMKRLSFIALGIVGLAFAPIVMREEWSADLSRPEELIETANSLSRSFLRTNSSLEVPELTSFSDIAKFAPLGIFTLLFRPLPGEVNNVWGFLAGVENLVVLLLALRALYRTRPHDLVEPLVGWALTVVLLWTFVYSIAAFQNLGTAARLKLEMKPILVGLLLYLGRARVAVRAASPVYISQPIPLRRGV